MAHWLQPAMYNTQSEQAPLANASSSSFKENMSLVVGHEDGLAAEQGSCSNVTSQTGLATFLGSGVLQESSLNVYPNSADFPAVSCPRSIMAIMDELEAKFGIANVYEALLAQTAPPVWDGGECTAPLFDTNTAPAPVEDTDIFYDINTVQETQAMSDPSSQLSTEERYGHLDDQFSSVENQPSIPDYQHPDHTSGSANVYSTTMHSDNISGTDLALQASGYPSGFHGSLETSPTVYHSEYPSASGSGNYFAGTESQYYFTNTLTPQGPHSLDPPPLSSNQYYQTYPNAEAGPSTQIIPPISRSQRNTYSTTVPNDGRAEKRSNVRKSRSQAPPPIFAPWQNTDQSQHQLPPTSWSEFSQSVPSSDNIFHDDFSFNSFPSSSSKSNQLPACPTTQPEGHIGYLTSYSLAPPSTQQAIPPLAGAEKSGPPREWGHISKEEEDRIEERRQGEAKPVPIPEPMGYLDFESEYTVHCAARSVTDPTATCNKEIRGGHSELVKHLVKVHGGTATPSDLNKPFQCPLQLTGMEPMIDPKTGQKIQVHKLCGKWCTKSAFKKHTFATAAHIGHIPFTGYRTTQRAFGLPPKRDLMNPMPKVGCSKCLRPFNFYVGGETGTANRHCATCFGNK